MRKIRSLSTKKEQNLINTIFKITYKFLILQARCKLDKILLQQNFE